MYRVFDCAIECDFALPGIPQTQQSKCDIQVEFAPGAADTSGFDWFHSWREKKGDTTLACARSTSQDGALRYLLRFPELADFVFCAEAVDETGPLKLLYHPHPNCDQNSLRHLLLDQVIPRLWSHSGHLVIHASAVRLQDGRVVAFAGESGWGKSTLAAALQARGCQLLSDDSISLKVHEQQVHLKAGYCGLRLLGDSIATLGLGESDWKAVSHYSAKRRLQLNAPAQAVVLDTLYFMTDPAHSSVLCIDEMAGAELITSLIQYSFLLDIHSRETSSQQFREAAAVVRALPVMHSLAYSRDYSLLPDLCDALTQ
ncbi:hypothetical protein EYC98_07840 [Halieaceae bacterium IMCC14734]|uniref:HPr kinase/phosphorylase C-terminal domain-containing protein n=1 Tax=Candidatus Litorirhabdus singularis TaxID=2518993 RepID=A0ABT3TEQ1_9GAMM|nr:hypothetical protein [Candidatus Litorirhabdus singularis]MCX2980787.1 hypothetical protein [Candidatus Litorirhabdus singularis]